MQKGGRVALAKIVLTSREHVMAIEPFGKIMLGTILRYDYEVRDEKGLARSVATPKIPKQMLSLASHILDSKAGHFEPSEFKDEFETERGHALRAARARAPRHAKSPAANGRAGARPEGPLMRRRSPAPCTDTEPPRLPLGRKSRRGANRGGTRRRTAPRGR